MGLQIVSTYPTSPEARAPSEASQRPRSMAREAPTPCGRHSVHPGPKPTLKTLLHTLTKYTKSPFQPSQSFPPSLSPAHSPPNTPTYHRSSIQLRTLIYLKQHTGPLDVSREGGASAGQVERTPGRATLTSWVVGPLHAGGVGRQQQQRVSIPTRITDLDTGLPS